VPLLQAAPAIRTVALFEEVRRRHPEIAPGGASHPGAPSGPLASAVRSQPGCDVPPGAPSSVRIAHQQRTRPPSHAKLQNRMAQVCKPSVNISLINWIRL
jgi:hypothetical protein